MTATVPCRNVFVEHPHLIARTDQLARIEELPTHPEHQREWRVIDPLLTPRKRNNHGTCA